MPCSDLADNQHRFNGPWRRLLALVCPIVLLCATIDADARQAASALQQREIHGQVVDAVTRTPIASATITFSARPNRAARLRRQPPVTMRGETRSDAAGGFVIVTPRDHDVVLAAGAPGYISGGYGQMWPGGPEAAIRSTATASESVVVRLWPYASLEGQVTQSDGSPIRGARLVVLVQSPSDKRYAAAAITDASGRYQVDRLVPGSYRVHVESTNTTMPAAIARQYRDGPSRELLVSLNLSGAPISSGEGTAIGDHVLELPPGLGASIPGRTMAYRAPPAAAVTLAPGERRGSVDFSFDVVPATRISGVILGPDGPVPLVGVRLFSVDKETPSGDSSAAAGATITDQDGVFTMLGVAPGRYELRVLHMPLFGVPNEENAAAYAHRVIQSRVAPRVRAALHAAIELDVDSSGVEGLQVHLANGPVLSGTVESADGRPASATVTLTPLDGDLRQVRIEAFNGRFRVGGIAPGGYTVSVPPGSATVIHTAMLGGHDVSKSVLTLASGDYDLSVTVASAVALALDLPDGTFEPDGRDPIAIFAFPADPSEACSEVRCRAVQLTEEVQQAFERLSPGDYVVVAVRDALFHFDWRHPLVLERLRARAVPVSVGAGQTSRVSVTPVEVPR